jgi:hypothetical protein
MLSLHFLRQFSIGCGVFKEIFVIISHNQSNLSISLRYSENGGGNPYRSRDSRCSHDVGDRRISEKLSYVFRLRIIE